MARLPTRLLGDIAFATASGALHEWHRLHSRRHAGGADVRRSGPDPTGLRGRPMHVPVRAIDARIAVHSGRAMSGKLPAAATAVRSRPKTSTPAHAARLAA